MTTRRRTLCGGPPGAGGYRALLPGPGESHEHRRDLAEPPARAGQALLTVAHLSDLHLCDAQSPARVELLDRWADPDSPIRDELGEVGTYRAQELLTAQVADAMVRAVNAVGRGPVAGAPLDLTVVTGDNTDNAQANELTWYLAALEGGSVRPDSGDPTRWEGVADGDVDDERFWHPETEGSDLPRRRFGFPRVPGLLAAARAGFDTAGLQTPWLAVHGNHDRMLQGTVPATGDLSMASTGRLKPIALPEHWSTDAVRELILGLGACDPAALAALRCLRARRVTADAERRVFSRAEFVAAHFGPASRPHGHGFTGANRQSGLAYYRHGHGRVTVLVLDTVNEHGGWQGSVDPDQLDWLEEQLTSADAERGYVVLASHHPLRTLINDTGAPRVLAPEVASVLDAHPCVVLWLNGHTHHTSVTPHRTWWEVTAPSLLDWPQQGRIVELIRAPGTLTVATTMLDHAGPAPWDSSVGDPGALASLARELAANDWQGRGLPLEQHPRAGGRDERNVLLHLRDPWN
ncbi:MAG: TIGR03767 family metallophosphoesterase [Acidimicrobiales bacterium]